MIRVSPGCVNIFAWKITLLIDFLRPRPYNRRVTSRAASVSALPRRRRCRAGGLAPIGVLGASPRRRDRLWVRDRDGWTHEAPPPREHKRAGAHWLVPLRRTADDLLAEWRALGVRDDVSHVVQVGGRSIVVLGARAGDRESPAVWLDPDHGVVRSLARERLPKGPALADLTLSEHRSLPAGFFFPRRQKVFVDGRLVMLVTVRSVVVDSNLPDALFDPEAPRR
jgi:hypothetical protein